MCDEKYVLGIHRAETHLNATVYVLINILIDKNIISLKEFNDAYDKALKTERFSSILKKIDEQLDLIEKYESEDPATIFIKKFLEKDNCDD